MSKSSNAISTLIDRQRPNWSLEQPFYTGEQIFALERESWFPRQWMLMAHLSELPKTGAHIVRDLFGESIIIVRAEGGICAFYNVCPHRGSRICRTDGHAPLLVCPYHAWSFKLTGDLHSRSDVPEGIDPSTLGLRSVPVEIMEGLIFCALKQEDLPDFTPVKDALVPAMQHHGFNRARIAAQKSYAVNANWKLAIENAFECYHCPNAHPEYTKVNGHVRVTGKRSISGAATWDLELADWAKAIDPDAPLNRVFDVHGALDRVAFRLTRHPIGGGRRTQSRDGCPVSTLMGDFTDYDGGETLFRFGRFSFASATNDYITLIQIMPCGPQKTEMVFTWLVDENAPAEVDVEAIQWMWDVTTLQDKKIVDDNAAGVRSQAYKPGPYTSFERSAAAFVASYLDEMRSLAIVSDRTHTQNLPL